MTLKELCEALNLPRSVALRLVKKIPGARKDAGGAGKIPQWVIPDDAIDGIDPELIVVARAEALAGAGRTSESDRSSSSVSAGDAEPDPALREERQAIEREKLAVERIKAQTARLEAEAARARVERELDSYHAPKPVLDPALAERFSRVERALDDVARRPMQDPTAGVAELVKNALPLLGPFLERLATPLPPVAVTPTVGPTEVLALAEKIKALVGTPDAELRRAVRDAFREGLELGRERTAAAEPDAPASTWATTLQGTMQGLAPYLPDLVNGLQGLIAPRRAMTAGSVQSSPHPEGTAMSMNPVVFEIVTALLDELRKPPEARDLAGIAAFLESIPLTEDMTLFDRFVPLAQAPEALAKISLRLIDPRLIDSAVWPAVKDLLAQVRKQMEQQGERR